MFNTWRGFYVLLIRNMARESLGAGECLKLLAVKMQLGWK